MAKPMRVAVVSLSPLREDWRVRRTIEALAEAGHEVIAIGYGAGPIAGASGYIELPQPRRGLRNRLETVLARGPANLWPGSAALLHYIAPQHRAVREALLRVRPDVVHANDWPTLPAAASAKHLVGAKVVYDSHEFAVEEHADNMLWRLISRSAVAALEGRYVPIADQVITVSRGIAEELATAYRLRSLPTIIRNVPPYQRLPFRPSASPPRLLFHGLLKAGRGIETLIAAVGRLDRHMLTIRGTAAPDYRRQLLSLVGRAAPERIRLETAVAAAEVVSAAAESDLGIFAPSLLTGHNRHALPNKVFEYAMAGLGVIASSGSDLVQEFASAGFVQGVDATSSESLAAAVGALQPAEINAMKRSALAAATELNWDAEKARLLAVYREFEGNPAPAASRRSSTGRNTGTRGTHL
jgi:glycogen(starch) synthase